MQGFGKGGAGLFGVEALAPELIASDSLWVFLAGHREVLFPEEMFADLFPSKRGRPSTPGPVIAMVLLLQAMEGLSDRQAVERMAFDLRWKRACGLGIDEVGVDHSVLVYWRARIAASCDPDRIFRAVGLVVESCGALKGKRRRVVDSTVVDDAVARQDTVTLLIWQVHRIRMMLPRLAEWIDCLPGRTYYADRTKPNIDWSSSLAREDLVTVLVNDAYRICERAYDEIEQMAEQVEGFDSEAVLDQVGLLALLAGQDVEVVEGSTDAAPRWRIARKVAPERVLSVVDIQTRHVRKSRASKKDGYKVHATCEPETGLVTGAQASLGAGEGSSDAANATEMLDRELAGGDGEDEAGSGHEIGQVLGDSAYDCARMLARCDDLGVEPVIKPRPLRRAVAGGVSIDDFEVDRDQRQVRCPGGFTRPISPSGQVDFTAHCHRCVLRPQCTKAEAGRVLTLGPQQLRSREHRAKARGQAFQDDYRAHRPMAERAIAWLTRPGRRTPYRGQAKTDAWIKRRAAAVNIKRLHALGLTHQDGTWVLDPAPA